MSNRISFSITGTGLQRGQSLVSSNGKFTLDFKGDGTLLLQKVSPGRVDLVTDFGIPPNDRTELWFSLANGTVVGLLGIGPAIPLATLSDVPTSLELTDEGAVRILRDANGTVTELWKFHRAPEDFNGLSRISFSALGSGLRRGQFLASPNKAFVLSFESDGRLNFKHSARTPLADGSIQEKERILTDFGISPNDHTELWYSLANGIVVGLLGVGPAIPIASLSELPTSLEVTDEGTVRILREADGTVKELWKFQETTRVFDEIQSNAMANGKATLTVNSDGNFLFEGKMKPDVPIGFHFSVAVTLGITDSEGRLTIFQASDDLGSPLNPFADGVKNWKQQGLLPAIKEKWLEVTRAEAHWNLQTEIEAGDIVEEIFAPILLIAGAAVLIVAANDPNTECHWEQREPPIFEPSDGVQRNMVLVCRRRPGT